MEDACFKSENCRPNWSLCIFVGAPQWQCRDAYPVAVAVVCRLPAGGEDGARAGARARGPSQVFAPCSQVLPPGGREGRGPDDDALKPVWVDRRWTRQEGNVAFTTVVWLTAFQVIEMTHIIKMILFVIVDDPTSWPWRARCCQEESGSAGGLSSLLHTVTY